MAQKTITRWVAKESNNSYQFWSEKPRRSASNTFWGSDGFGNSISDGFCTRACSGYVKAVVPALKSMKVGQCRKIKITVYE